MPVRRIFRRTFGVATRLSWGGGVGSQVPAHSFQQYLRFFGLRPNRHIYLCPQTLFKFHPEFDLLLAGILEADPEGDLILIEGRVPEWTNRLRRRWETNLPNAAQRVQFLPAQPRDDFLALLECSDVVLDPIHFGGGNTSYEALGRGAAVVTLPGNLLRSRITTALYRKMGLEELIAHNADSYVQLSVRLATDARFRASVVDQIVNSSGALFEDPQEVRCLQSWLLSVV